MAEDEIKDPLSHMRQKIQQKKESTKNLAGLFAKAKQKTEQKEAAKFKATLKDEEDKRILGAVAGYFDIVTEEKLEQIENLFPMTTTALFDISKHVIQGDYGPRLLAEGMSLTETILQWECVLTLLLLQTGRSKDVAEGKIPRVFNQIKELPVFTEMQQIANTIPENEFEKICYVQHEKLNKKQHLVRKKADACIDLIHFGTIERKAFIKIFRRYLNNLAHPSNVSVKIMLKKEKSIDNTVQAALNIKNKPERLKSIDSIVGNLLGSNKISSAIKIVGSIKVKKDVSKPLINLVKQLLNPKRKDIDALIQNDQIDEAIHIADSMTNSVEKNNIYQRLISGLGLHKKVDKALSVAEKISDPEVRDFSLSSLVSGLISGEDFVNASKVAMMISDSGYRDDANSYIVRGILDCSSFEKALDFVSSISNPIERSHAAKVILSWARSYQDQTKIDEVSSRFALVK